MATRNSHPRARSGAPKQTTPRHVWLAALGLAAVARRRVRSTLDEAGGDAARWQRDAERFAIDAAAVARGAAITLQEVVGQRIEPRVAGMKSAAEARLGRLLAAFQGRPTRRKPVRKARKPPVKQAARRGTGARHKAATRVVRKGRG